MGGDAGQWGALAQARADRPSVPRLQPPLLLFLLLFLFRLEDLQLPLQLPFQLPLPPRRGLLPLRPPCALPFPFLVPLSVPFPALFTFPEPRPAALWRGLPRWTPVLPLACPARWLWAPAQKQEPLPLRGPVPAGRPGSPAPQQ